MIITMEILKRLIAIAGDALTGDNDDQASREWIEETLRMISDENGGKYTVVPSKTEPIRVSLTAEKNLADYILEGMNKNAG